MLHPKLLHCLVCPALSSHLQSPLCKVKLLDSSYHPLQTGHNSQLTIFYLFKFKIDGVEESRFSFGSSPFWAAHMYGSR